VDQGVHITLGLALHNTKWVRKITFLKQV